MDRDVLEKSICSSSIPSLSESEQSTLPFLSELKIQSNSLPLSQFSFNLRKGGRNLAAEPCASSFLLLQLVGNTTSVLREQRSTEPSTPGYPTCVIKQRREKATNYADAISVIFLGMS